MATWTFSDGTVVMTGGSVSGSGPIATLIRDLFRGAELFKRPCSVLAGPLPGGIIPLDPNNDWLMDHFLRDLGRTRHDTPTTDYVPRDGDVPERVRRAIDKANDSRGDGKIH